MCDLALLALALIDHVSFDFDEAVVLDAIQFSLLSCNAMLFSVILRSSPTRMRPRSVCKHIYVCISTHVDTNRVSPVLLDLLSISFCIVHCDRIYIVPKFALADDALMVR